MGHDGTQDAAHDSDEISPPEDSDDELVARNRPTVNVPAVLPGQALPAGVQEEEDTELYCFCQKISFGNMVACDNEKCERQWFHWACVGVDEEPVGEWLCPVCREWPREDIVIVDKDDD